MATPKKVIQDKIKLMHALRNDDSDSDEESGEYDTND
jgi:hypothetical protein